MFNTVTTEIEAGRIIRYEISRDGVPITYGQVLSLWESDREFRSFFNALLVRSEFEAFRWETPPLTQSTLNNPFEFILLHAFMFIERKTDKIAFQEHFSDEDSGQGIVSFQNLGGDATLIVPVPKTDKDAYGHLAAFVRNAPKAQIDTLWQTVGGIVKSRLNDTVIWLSTAGDGVAWLHIRLDTSPKYYGYAPYRERTA